MEVVMFLLNIWGAWFLLFGGMCLLGAPYVWFSCLVSWEFEKAPVKVKPYNVNNDPELNEIFEFKDMCHIPMHKAMYPNKLKEKIIIEMTPDLTCELKKFYPTSDPTKKYK